MAEGFIDGATITSGLTYLNLGRNASRPLWHRTSILETTYLLLHDNIRIIPRPRGLGGEHGDYAIAANEFSELIVDSDRRKAIFKTTVESASENNDLVKAAWEQSQQDKNFQTWADLQRHDRWKNQTLTYGGLYDKEFVPTISYASGYNEQDIRRVLEDSKDAEKVEQWSKHIDSWEDAQIANAGWVIGGFMRGFFYDSLATVEKLQLLTHPFRKHATRPSEVTEHHEVTNSSEVLVKLLIANALTEVTPERRVRTWAKTVKEARNHIKENQLKLPNTTQPKAEELAVKIAKSINLQGGPRYYRRLINTTLSFAAGNSITLLTGFNLSSWVVSAGILLLTELMDKSPGEKLGDFILKSDYQFRSIARSIPGRVERTLAPASETQNSGQQDSSQ